MSLSITPYQICDSYGPFVQEKRPAAELLWRISRACHLMGSIQPTKKKDYVFEGRLQICTPDLELFSILLQVELSPKFALQKFES